MSAFYSVLPEQNLLIVRDLRAKCASLEELYNGEIERYREQSVEEQDQLRNQIKALEGALLHQREESNEHAVLLRYCLSFI